MANMTKFESYMGFCSKARKMVTGYNTVLSEMEKGKVLLLVLASDLSVNTLDKITGAAKSLGVDYRVTSTIDELSHMTGKEDKGIYAIKDSNFANIIADAIDHNI